MGKRRGYSLLEVLVAVNLLAVLLLFVVGVIPIGNASVKRDAHYLVATGLGRQLLQAAQAGFWQDGTEENGIPVTGPWDGFAGTAQACLSTVCPTGTTPIPDAAVSLQAANSVFPPSPYPSVILSATSAGTPDTRQYYLYVTAQKVTGAGALIPPAPSSSAEPDFRYVQVIVFWQEKLLPGMTGGGSSWNQAGYRSITLSGMVMRKSGP